MIIDCTEVFCDVLSKLNQQKITFRILNHTPKSLFEKSSIIFQLCSSIVNLQNHLIKEVENEYKNTKL